MNELIKLGEKTYCIKSPVNVGIYIIQGNDVCLIDSGNSKEFGKIIEKILRENNWHLKYIINTHSHADHIGGNRYLQNKYNCGIYAHKIEAYFINTPILEAAMLYSANPLKEMHSHFLKAEESVAKDIKDLEIDGLNIIDLHGHSIGQIGVVTSDNVCFCGDAYTSEKILNKYAIQYVYDIDEYLKTLDFLEKTDYFYYVPAHGDVEENIEGTIAINKNNINKIELQLIKIINDGITFNNMLKEIFRIYHISMNTIQYHLIGATVKSFLTRMEKKGKLKIYYEDNEMILQII